MGPGSAPGPRPVRCLRFAFLGSGTDFWTFKPQLLNKNKLDTIKSCSEQSIRLFPLKVECLRSDLKWINNELDFNYLPPYVNSTSLPTESWKFSDSEELVDLPLSKLYANKVIPKSDSLRKALQCQLLWRPLLPKARTRPAAADSSRLVAVEVLLRPRPALLRILLLLLVKMFLVRIVKEPLDLGASPQAAFLVHT